MKKIALRSLLTIYLLHITDYIFSQTVYEHTSSTGIYLYLDEMATEKHITLNTAVKPYPRNLIAQKLKELTLKQDQLNKRQKAELQFYLREFYIELQSESIANKNQPTRISQQELVH